ncbi:hypothetical protein ACNKHU_24635 [Shigella flexneri]
MAKDIHFAAESANIPQGQSYVMYPTLHRLIFRANTRSHNGENYITKKEDRFFIFFPCTSKEMQG